MPEKQSITLRQLVDLNVESQLLIREIRNEPSVRAAMYTDHEIEINEHLGWISRLKADTKQIVFAVVGEKPVGVASINAIDRLHKKADWAFYLAAGERGGLGAAIEFAMIEFAMIDFAFGPLALEKLNCEVIWGNDVVVRMHKKFGFVEEGFRRSNIIKGDRRIGVHFLGLTKEDWEAARKSVSAASQARFDVAIEWSPERPEIAAIDDYTTPKASVWDGVDDGGGLASPAPGF